MSNCNDNNDNSINTANGKTIKELIKKDRRDFEEFLSKSFGKNVFVPEMDVFSSKCGCYGIMIMVRGVLIDEADVFKNRIIKKLEELDDIEAYDKAKKEKDEVISFEQAVKEIRG